MNRRLTRSRNGMIGGAAAGVAAWMNADPALVRIAWALLVPLTGGAALLAYIVAWVVVPEEPTRNAAAGDPGDGAAVPVTEEAEPRRIDEGQAALLIGGGLVLIGLYFLVREYLPRIDWSFVWPLILVGVGVLILLGAARRR
ncbi:MAG: PspC domain-containing protein [Candidatus Limnocylindria bacterium]